MAPSPRTKTVSVQRAFGERVRALRQSRAMTQDELSERCGLFRTYMSRIENGHANPTLTMIEALAVSLGVSIPALFDDSRLPAPGKAPPRPSRGRVR